MGKPQHLWKGVNRSDCSSTQNICRVCKDKLSNNQDDGGKRRSISMDAYQRKLSRTQIHNINLKEQEQIEIKHNVKLDFGWFGVQLELVLFRFSQTAVKTFNPYKSHVSRPSQQGSNTGILSARSLLTSLKWFLRHNRLQSRHSLQAGSPPKKKPGEVLEKQ